MSTGLSGCRGRRSPACSGALVCLGLTYFLSNATWMRLVWSGPLIGMSIYAFYGFRHSRLRTNDAHA